MVRCARTQLASNRTHGLRVVTNSLVYIVFRFCRYQPRVIRGAQFGFLPIPLNHPNRHGTPGCLVMDVESCQSREPVGDKQFDDLEHVKITKFSGPE